MARHDKKSRRAKRKSKRIANAKSRELRLQGDRAFDTFDLESVLAAELLNLVPVAKVAQIVGEDVSWSVQVGKSEIQNWSVLNYNHIVTSDVHVRCQGVPEERHPLYRFFESHSESRAYATKVGYRHNQVLIQGLCRGIECVALHVGSVGLSDLHLGYIELANPNEIATAPMDGEQKYSGLGHGVLQDIIDSVRTFASSNGFRRVTGYAVDRLRADIFCRREFSLDRNGFMYETAMRLNQQIPIVIELAPPK